MNDEARLAAWHRNVYESYDEEPYCEGCEERDAEIERLTGAVEELTIDNQGLVEALRAAHEDTVGLRAEIERLWDLIGAPFRCTSEEEFEAAMTGLREECVRSLFARAERLRTRSATAAVPDPQERAS